MTTPWQDRRGMFQKGKELHEPSSPTARRFSETGSGVVNAVRRASTSSSGGSPIDKTTSNTSGNYSTSGTGGRRRSSAASNGALFNNLNTMKRGSQDYNERRASQTEMQNQGGLVSGWFNKTFRGIQPPQGGAVQQSGNDKSDKRGVME